MKTMRIGVAAIAALLWTIGCGSTSGELADTFCDCFHCDDASADAADAYFTASQDIAEAYECGAEWDDWATCVLEEGECDEDEAQYSTRGRGECSADLDTGVNCASQAECAGMGPGAVCSGTCRTMACEGSGEPCSSDDECSGKDRCDDEEDDLDDCLSDASDDPSVPRPDLD